MVFPGPGLTEPTNDAAGNVTRIVDPVYNLPFYESLSKGIQPQDQVLK